MSSMSSKFITIICDSNNIFTWNIYKEGCVKGNENRIGKKKKQEKKNQCQSIFSIRILFQCIKTTTTTTTTYIVILI